jgi:hypothetical protein
MKNPNGKIIPINRSPSFWSSRAQLAGMLAACLGLMAAPGVRGASGTNVITINPTNPTVFFRLRYP